MLKIMGVPLCCIISFDYTSNTLTDNHTVCRLKQIILVIDQTEMKKVISLKSFTCTVLHVKECSLKASKYAFRQLLILLLCRTTEASLLSTRFFTR